MTDNAPDRPEPAGQEAPDASARTWRSRASRLAAIWLLVGAIEYAAWRFVLGSAFYRDFFLPVVVAVLIAGLAVSWRVVGRRERDRRRLERRKKRGRRNRDGGPAPDPSRPTPDA